MKRLLTGLSIGMVVGALLFGISRTAFAEGNKDESAPVQSSDGAGIAPVFRESLLQPFQMAGSEIADNETKRVLRGIGERVPPE